MKVWYRPMSHDGGATAYLEDLPERDGTHIGTNKYTDEPVRVKWDGHQWVEVPHNQEGQQP